MALIDNLIAYWSLDEPGGQRNDSHGLNHLADNNTVGQAAGKVGNAADFVVANDEFLSHAHNSDLALSADQAFTWAMWLYVRSLSAGDAILTKSAGGGGSREYYIGYGASDAISFGVGDGTNFAGVTSQSISLNTWILAFAWHDPAVDTLNVQINTGSSTAIAWTTGTLAGTGNFNLGGDVTFAGFTFDGRIDECAFWKRVLTPSERTDLYNGGAGRGYSYINPNAGRARRTARPLGIQGVY